MGLTKMEPHELTIDGGGGEIDGNRVAVQITKSVDHWDFLEEIEAPMWADLISEAESAYRVIDDEWFHITHPFHQCSSRKLISAVSISGEEGCTNLIHGPPSPKLPPSVSKSRGKDYKSREWRQSKVTLSKQHPVKNLITRSSLVHSGSGKGVKPIFRTDKLEVHEGSRASSICESGVTEATGPNYSSVLSNFGVSKSHSSSLVYQGGGSNSTSTITSEGSGPQQKKSLEVSSQIPGHTSELLSTLRTSLRRSCVTRQASRVEVNGGRKSEGCKSSSSKSSVGSSSHPCYDGKNPTLGETQNKDKTPDSRNVKRVSQAPRIKPKVPTLSKGPTVQVRGVSSNTRGGNEIAALKETTKAKAQKHSLHTKALVPHRVNEQGHLTVRKAKSGVDNKKTVSGLVAASQKAYARDGAVGCMSQLQKPARKGVAQKSNRIGAKEKTTGRSEGKEAMNAVKRVYFR